MLYCEIMDLLKQHLKVVDIELFFNSPPVCYSLYNANHFLKDSIYILYEFFKCKLNLPHADSF